MLTIEFHDTDVINASRGTLLASAGRYGAIEYDFQAEAYMHELTDDGVNFARAYILSESGPRAVWQRLNDGPLQCIAHSNDYVGAPKLDMLYVYPDAMLIESKLIDRKDVSPDLDRDWASGRLVGATATAILFDEQGIVAAWERVRGMPQLVARGPIKRN